VHKTFTSFTSFTFLQALLALHIQFYLFFHCTYCVCKIIRTKTVTTVIGGWGCFHGNQFRISECCEVSPS